VYLKHYGILQTIISFKFLSNLKHCIQQIIVLCCLSDLLRVYFCSHNSETVRYFEAAHYISNYIHLHVVVHCLLINMTCRRFKYWHQEVDIFLYWFDWQLICPKCGQCNLPQHSVFRQGLTHKSQITVEEKGL
jgi:hypothetical protein